jgi:glycosyltransferase involved in cell wall biosynthesis
MPKVSVIVPNYNHERYLQKRLDSIFNQTYQDFDVLLLDDASSDSSVDILREYADDARVRLIVNEQNSGSPFKQWNKGIELVQGDYLWIAESDDYADLDFLSQLVTSLEAHPKAGIAYCQSWLVPRETADYPPVLTESMHEMFVDHARWQTGYANSGKDELANYLTFKNIIPNASGVLIRRSVLAEGIRAPESMKLAGDWMFWARILLEADIVFVPKPLNFFREPHTGSQRDRTKQQALELIEGLDIYGFIRAQVPLEPALRKRVLAYHVKLWGILSCLRLLTWETNKKVYAKFLDIHQEFSTQSLILIRLPFLVYYVSAPLRKVAPAMVFFKYLRRFRHKLGRLFR